MHYVHEHCSSLHSMWHIRYEPHKYRVSRAMAEALVADLHPYLARKYTRFKTALCVRKIVYMSVDRLANIGPWHKFNERETTWAPLQPEVQSAISHFTTSEKYQSIVFLDAMLISICRVRCSKGWTAALGRDCSGCRFGKCQQLHDARTRTDSTRTHPMYGCAGVVVSACCDQVRLGVLELLTEVATGRQIEVCRSRAAGRRASHTNKQHCTLLEYVIW